MKKLRLALLVTVAAIALISGMTIPTAASMGEGTAAQMKITVPFSSFEKDKLAVKVYKREPPHPRRCGASG